MPLPKGRVRFYRRDDDGQLEFTGENEIDHTPKDELIRIYTGNAFDLTGERRRVDYKLNQQARWVDESFEIKVRNHKTTPVEVRIVEHLYRWSNWDIAKILRHLQKGRLPNRRLHRPNSSRRRKSPDLPGPLFLVSGPRQPKMFRKGCCNRGNRHRSSLASPQQI